MPTHSNAQSRSPPTARSADDSQAGAPERRAASPVPRIAPGQVPADRNSRRRRTAAPAPTPAVKERARIPTAGSAGIAHPLATTAAEDPPGQRPPSAHRRPPGTRTPPGQRPLRTWPSSGLRCNRRPRTDADRRDRGPRREFTAADRRDRPRRRDADRRPRGPRPLPTLDGPSGFTALGVSEILAAILQRQGINDPYPIQQATIGDAIAGRDILGRGRTGSGKTLAFCLPLVTRLAKPGTVLAPRRSPRGLILVPTRELAAQVMETLQSRCASTSAWRSAWSSVARRTTSRSAGCPRVRTSSSRRRVGCTT